MSSSHDLFQPSFSRPAILHRAEDVVQASLLKAHKALLADDREIALRGWLFTIVRNGALNAIRDEPDWQEIDPSYDGVPQPPAIAEQNEELQALVVAICALPENQRRALVGRELEGEGHAELAGELGTTATAVRGLIFRARTALRDALGATIPLPILRMLLNEGTTVAGAAGAGGGAGIGLGLGAAGIGTTAKVAATFSAAALVLGGGIALDRHAGDRVGTGTARAAEQDAAGGALPPKADGESAGATVAERTGGATQPSPDSASSHGQGSSGHSGADSTGSGGDHGPAGGGGQGGPSEPGGGPHPGPGGGSGGGHSGPGGGGPAPDDDGGGGGGTLDPAAAGRLRTTTTAAAAAAAGTLDPAAAPNRSRSHLSSKTNPSPPAPARARRHSLRSRAARATTTTARKTTARKISLHPATVRDLQNPDGF